MPDYPPKNINEKFVVEEATLSETKKTIKLWGLMTYKDGADGETKTRKQGFAIEAAQFEKSAREERAGNDGKVRMMVFGLEGVTVKDPVIKKSAGKDGQKDFYYLQTGLFVSKTDPNKTKPYEDNMFKEKEHGTEGPSR